MPSSSGQPLRLVLDTNVVVAGLLWSGPPRRLIDLAIEGEAVELFSSPALLDELTHTLGYSKFTARIQSFGTSIAALVAQYSALVLLVMPLSVPRVVAGDADDTRCPGFASRRWKARRPWAVHRRLQQMLRVTFFMSGVGRRDLRTSIVTDRF